MKEQEDISIVKDIREKLLEYVLKGIPEKDSYYVSTKNNLLNISVLCKIAGVS